jgi:hypothetical protein
VVAAEPAYGYEFSADVIRAFFRPYVRQLRKAIWAASGVGIRFEPDRKLAWRDVLSGIKRSRYILTI